MWQASQSRLEMLRISVLAGPRRKLFRTRKGRYCFVLQLFGPPLYLYVERLVWQILPFCETKLPSPQRFHWDWLSQYPGTPVLQLFVILPGVLKTAQLPSSNYSSPFPTTILITELCEVRGRALVFKCSTISGHVEPSFQPLSVYIYFLLSYNLFFIRLVYSSFRLL